MSRAMSHHRAPKQAWVIDYQIPVAMILSLFVGLAGQAAYAFSWAQKIEYRVQSVEKVVGDIAPQGDRITRLEAKLDAISSNVNDIKTVVLSFSPKSSR